MRRWLPLAALVAVAAVFYATGLHRHLSLATLKEQRETLQALVAERPVVTAAAYLAAYASAVALSVGSGGMAPSRR